MEHSTPREANSRSASQEIPHFLQNLMTDYQVHKDQSLVIILSQINPVYPHTLYL
jgi:hypothetical protein